VALSILESGADQLVTDDFVTPIGR